MLYTPSLQQAAVVEPFQAISCKHSTFSPTNLRGSLTSNSLNNENLFSFPQMLPNQLFHDYRIYSIIHTVQTPIQLHQIPSHSCFKKHTGHFNSR